MFLDEGNKKLLWIIVIVVPPMVLLPSVYIFCRRRRKWKEKGNLLFAYHSLICLYDKTCDRTCKLTILEVVLPKQRIWKQARIC